MLISLLARDDCIVYIVQESTFLLVIQTCTREGCLEWTGRERATSSPHSANERSAFACNVLRLISIYLTRSTAQIMNRRGHARCAGFLPQSVGLQLHATLANLWGIIDCFA